MDCAKFNKNIDNFIQNKIEVEELEEYIEHYHSCHNCREELEIYFLVHKIFDNKNSNVEDSLKNFNLKNSLLENIKEKEDLVYSNYKYDFIVKMMFYIGNTVAFATAIYFMFIFIFK